MKNRFVTDEKRVMQDDVFETTEIPQSQRRWQRRIPWRSVRFRITAILLLFLLVLSVAMVGYNAYTIRRVQRQIEEYNMRILTLYMGQTDRNIAALDSYINSIISTNTDLRILNGEVINTDKSDQVLAAVRFAQGVTGMLQQYYWLHSFFVVKDQDILAEISVRGTISVNFQKEIVRYTQSIGPIASRTGWRVINMNSSYYVVSVVRTGKAYLCAIAAMEDLMVSMELLDKEFSEQFFLMSKNGEIAYRSVDTILEGVNLNTNRITPYLTGENNRYTVIKKESAVSDMLAVILYDRNVLQGRLMEFRTILILIIICFILAGFCVYVLLRHMLLNPLRELQHVSNDILLGNLESRLKTNSVYEEFSDTNRSINKMLDRIQTLRVNVYEEQLENQQLEIDKLQQQIKPHFLLNSFNLIYNMAQEQDYEQIQKMSLSLARYFRYRVNSSRNLVPLAEELECVKNYLNIQKFRYADEFDYSIIVDDSLKNAQVVALMIQTFAENSVIHALRSRAMLLLTIKARKINYGGDQALFIEITDTGKGYPKEVLTAFKQESMGGAARMGVGIYNIKRRLQLIFGSRARILLSNRYKAKGARTTIIMPLIQVDSK